MPGAYALERPQSISLPGQPVGVAAIYQRPDDQLPVLTAAAGNALYVFKNLKPFLKNTLPPIEIAEEERDIWANARSETVDVDAMCDALLSLQDSHQELSGRSLHLLALEPEDRASYVERIKDLPIVSEPSITAMATMYKNIVEERAPQCIVLGTEQGQVLILSPEKFAALARFNLPGAIACLSVAGAFETDYRILAVSRDNKLYIIKDQVAFLSHMPPHSMWAHSKAVSDLVIDLPSPAVDCQRIGKAILVTCTNGHLLAFNSKGRRLWEHAFSDVPLSCCAFDYKIKMLRGVMVATADRHVHVFTDTGLIDTFSSPMPLAGVAFDHIWRGTYVFAGVGTDGSLFLARVKKGADFTNRNRLQGAPPEQNVRIKVPKKTQLYVDQTMREKAHAVQMHRIFQRDLYLMQLNIARNYVKAIKKSLAPDVKTQDVSLHVDAEVHGIGPHFKVIVKVQNTSPKQLARDIHISFHADPTMYELEDRVVHLPCAVPGVIYRKATLVKYLESEELTSSPITAHVYMPPNPRPLVTALIEMPISEPLINVR
ncbi:uncharacterized protein MONBRDRAFT_24309 [Monosiga brevicollis MX1]|uniref:Bardet-Biedl syndrome 1 N-terminal domain-containing protein n=1 Tax=Monosiga brevicollis TaxID=81824 RepID=A9UW13_MONBE|nr:uncharacterized protein MONBRDRAFT_24309 [Monosiga brevicollis MX1]EDQ90689.1 predicted protein [Monosiga brevicollis MX1]|eukprot:XP_001744740.1 hypothetical protein [Monosiga brevicollis MX1]